MPQSGVGARTHGRARASHGESGRLRARHARSCARSRTVCGLFRCGYGRRRRGAPRRRADSSRARRGVSRRGTCKSRRMRSDRSRRGRRNAPRDCGYAGGRASAVPRQVRYGNAPLGVSCGGRRRSARILAVARAETRRGVLALPRAQRGAIRRVPGYSGSLQGGISCRNGAHGFIVIIGDEGLRVRHGAHRSCRVSRCDDGKEPRHSRAQSKSRGVRRIRPSCSSL